MSHFEDAMKMNINLERQDAMIRGNCPEIDRQRDFYNQQRLLNGIAMDQAERQRLSSNNGFGR